MNRKSFIKNNLLALGGLSVFPLPAGRSSQNEKLSASMVKEFVSAGHRDLNKVKELLGEEPNLLYASHDWGGGDFEEAIEGAGHVGNVEIANFLINQGARPNIFVMAMLGKTDLVKSTLETFPALIYSKGAHGFTLLHHAMISKQTELIEYLKEQGLSEKQIPLR